MTDQISVDCGDSLQIGSGGSTAEKKRTSRSLSENTHMKRVACKKFDCFNYDYIIFA